MVRAAGSTRAGDSRRIFAWLAIALITVFFCFDWITVQSHGDAVPAPAVAAGTVLLVVCGVGCVLYRDRPLWSVIAVAGCATLSLAIPSLSVPLYWTVAVCLAAFVTSYRLPPRLRPWTAAWILGITAAEQLMHWHEALDLNALPAARSLLSAVASVVVAWLVLGFFFLLGAQVRQRRDRIDELKQRIEFAHVRERTQIAREMHDIVAHSLAGITALADGARYAAASNPAEAQEALETISEESRTALSQMRGLLSVLREEDSSHPAGATPGRRDFEDLFADARARGLDLTVDGFDTLPEDLPALTQFTLYRICQEVVTNMLRHASEQTGSIVFSTNAKEVVVVAANPASISKQESDGFGLVGIRERVAAHGGRVRIADSDGSFVLEVEVPR